MTVLALLALVALLLVDVTSVARPYRNPRRTLSQAGAAQSVERAVRLGLVNPAPPRRWSSDRKPEPEPAPRVLDLMPRH
ncbi:MAG: hypothetical protein ABW022_15825 [Actinoplanes sp.]